nr:hypothetical protein [uncultured Pedobacter sp.]
MLRKIGERNEFLEPLENAGKVSGFQSPAEDYAGARLDIAQILVHDPLNTFYFKSEADLPAFFIRKNDILVVDRSKSPRNENLIVAWHNEAWFVCQYMVKGKTKFVRSCSNGVELCVGEEGLNLFGVIAGHYSEDL